MKVLTYPTAFPKLAPGAFSSFTGPRTPMARVPMSPRSAPLRKRSDGSRRRGWRWAAVRKERSAQVQWKCEICGKGGLLEGHHKRLKSQGGQDVIENCAMLCLRCHRRVHQHVAWAVSAGWIIQREGVTT